MFREIIRLIAHRGPYKGSREFLTPVLQDFPSLVPLAVVAARTLLEPRSAVRLANEAVGRYAITADAIQRVVSATNSMPELSDRG